MADRGLPQQPGPGVTAASADFYARLAPHRGEMVAFCYRMVGSVHDAEDLTQDTYLRAWRARDQYDDARASLRTWLYRIATNVCLTALTDRGRRPLPSGLVAPRDALAPFAIDAEITWLQPLPDTMVAVDPSSTAVEHSGLRLAFVAALQHLSARQRGALILREVLGYSAAEAAEILGISVAAVNSSLQRARARMKASELRRELIAEPSPAEQRAWVDRYMIAFARADVDALKRLLTDDVVMEMPPLLNWFSGTDNYGRFMHWVFEANGTDWHLVPVAANGQPAFAAYNRVGPNYRLHTLQVLTVTACGISRNSVFQDDAIFSSFGLAPSIDPPSQTRGGPRFG
ncbi:MAG: RNA polymerase subunit sigma-70 [Acidimicrobiales bacterium]